jgi:hypothetical protein
MLDCQQQNIIIFAKELRAGWEMFATLQARMF